MRNKSVPVLQEPPVIPKSAAVQGKYKDVKSKVEAEKLRQKEEEEAEKKAKEIEE